MTTTAPSTTTVPTDNCTAFVFPGQGSQFAGMIRDLSRCDVEALHALDDAEYVSGLPVRELMTRADAATLADPEVAQVVVLAHSITLLRQVRAEGADFAAGAGHSLGEYTAMVATGAMEWADAVRIVAARGKAMAAAARTHPSSMAAIVGLELELVVDICVNAAAQPVVIANVNSPRQCVVSGTTDGVQQVIEEAQAARALRAKRLSVGGAYHSPLMASAQEELAPLLRDVALTTPERTLISSITGGPVEDVEAYRQRLIGQITAPVRWRSTVDQLAANGINSYIEVGPGRVLAGLGREMQRDATHASVLTIKRAPVLGLTEQVAS